MMFLHQHKIIHRDLKQENILLDNLLHPHITDFGLSKFVDNYLQSQSQQCGTCKYMAPEVIEGTHYTGKVDVYSFGILMYEVTYSDPYPLLTKNKLTPFKFNQKFVNENYRPTFSVPVKKSIQKLIEKCWSKNPAERPTFEEIFTKLAFGRDYSIEDIYDEQKEEEENDESNNYYLENVDVDEVVSYADEINDVNADNQYSSVDLSKIKDLINSQIEPLRDENKQLKEKVRFLEQKISDIEKSSKEIIDKLIDEINNNKQGTQNQTQQNTQQQLQQIIQNQEQQNTQQQQQITQNQEQQNTQQQQQIIQNQEQQNTQQQQITQNQEHQNTQQQQQITQNQTQQNTQQQQITQNQEQQNTQQQQQITQIIYNQLLSFAKIDNSEFTGIINYFNLNGKNKMAVTASSIYDDGIPSNVTLHQSTDKFYCSNNQLNSWLCFDFIDNRIIPTSYTIRNGNWGPNNHYLKNWLIEVSEDYQYWQELARERDCSIMRGPNIVHTFKISREPRKPIRYLRIRLIGENWYKVLFQSHYHLVIESFEIYGKLILNYK